MRIGEASAESVPSEANPEHRNHAYISVRAVIVLAIVIVSASSSSSSSSSSSPSSSASCVQHHHLYYSPFYFYIAHFVSIWPKACRTIITRPPIATIVGGTIQHGVLHQHRTMHGMPRLHQPRRPTNGIVANGMARLHQPSPPTNGKTSLHGSVRPNQPQTRGRLAPRRPIQQEIRTTAGAEACGRKRMDTKRQCNTP